MNNIPQGTLQQVADAAFDATEFGSIIAKASHIDFPHQGSIRRAVIQHTLDNPALAPFLAGGIGILRPIAEMPETVPDGCVMVTAWERKYPTGVIDSSKSSLDTHFAILRLPAAEARQERPVGFNSALETWGAAEATTPAEPEPAAKVPLGPEDVPPGSVFRSKDQPLTLFWTVEQVWKRGFFLSDENVTWHEAMERMEINTSLPDTGRWDATAWRPCSKPAGKEVTK